LVAALEGTVACAVVTDGSFMQAICQTNPYSYSPPEAPATAES
jgi:hypothetical protein